MTAKDKAKELIEKFKTATTMKTFRLKFAFRFFTILDVMFAERFELKTYRNGRKTIEALRSIVYNDRVYE